MRLLCRRLACVIGLAVVAMALVACGSGPGAKAQPSVSSAKPLPLVLDLEIGKAHTIDLADKFSAAEGETLTFKAVPDELSVATAKVDKTKLTITAVAAGRATITVTATGSLQRERTEDSQATQRLTVIVPAPDEEDEEEEEEEEKEEEDPPPTVSPSSDCPSTLPKIGGLFKVTLKIIRDTSGKCSLDLNHSLVYNKPELSITRPGKGTTGNEWTITANLRGKHFVDIRDDNTGDNVGEILVEVPNTEPKLKRNTDGTPSRPGDVSLFPPGYPGTPGDILTTTTPLAAAEYFTDVDDEDNRGADAAREGVFEYKIEYKPPEIVIDTEGGFVVDKAADADSVGSATIEIEAVVLKPLTKKFEIELYAYDKANGRSDNPVTFTFTAPVKPQQGTYEVAEDTKGGFEKLRIGNRLDVDHAIVFDVSAGAVGFNSVADLFTKFTKTPVGLGSTPTTAADAATAAGCPDDLSKAPTWTSDATEGDDAGEGCYTITSSTNDVEIRSFAGSEKPTVMFRLPSEYRRLSETAGATITITYNVWVATKKDDDGNFLDKGDTIKKAVRQQLVLDIHRCVDTDCPLDNDS